MLSINAMMERATVGIDCQSGYSASTVVDGSCPMIATGVGPTRETALEDLRAAIESEIEIRDLLSTT